MPGGNLGGEFRSWHHLTIASVERSTLPVQKRTMQTSWDISNLNRIDPLLSQDV